MLDFITHFFVVTVFKCKYTTFMPYFNTKTQLFHIIFKKNQKKVRKSLVDSKKHSNFALAIQQ